MNAGDPAAIPANTTTFGLIETAIHARVRLAGATEGVLGYAFRTVATLPADLDELLPEHVQQFPALWTVFGGFKPVRSFGDGSDEIEASYHLVVAAENARNEAATRLGASAGEVGSYQLLLDAIRLLRRQTFGLPIGPLQLGAAQSLYTGKTLATRKISVFAVGFTTRFVLDDSWEPDDLTIGDFDTFHSSWDIRPGDELSGLPPWAYDDQGEPLPMIDRDFTATDQQHVYRPDAVDHETGLYTLPELPEEPES